MKKYSLKPLGDSCIHILCKSAFLIGLLMTFCLTACSDDDDDTVTPVFPEKQNIICNTGDTREFTFTANTNWSLASSAIWCKFKTDDMEEFTLSGAAGTHTVTLMVTGDNQKVDNISVAKLELTMGGQTIVIGEITRSKVEYKLTIYDAVGNEVDENTGALVVGYDDFVKFSVKANFRFAATHLPGWVNLDGGSMVGAVNEKVSGGLKIIRNESREKYPVDASNENVITFSDEEGRVFRSVKVRYAGMPLGVMELTLPSYNKYGWTVSLDGKTFTQGSGGVAGTGSSNTTFRNRLPFTVKTFNDEYKVVFVVKGSWNNDLYLMDEYDEWMSYEDEPKDGNIKLKVNEFIPEYGQTERVGYVLVLTKEEYETIGKDKLEETIIDGENIVYKYQENNLVLQFTQKEVKNDDIKQFFSAVDGTDYMTPIECTPYTEKDAEYYSSEYGVKGISEIKQPGLASTYVTVSFEIWDAKCYFLDNEADAPVGIISPAGTTIGVDTQLADGKDIFIIVSGETSDDKAMLILRTSNAAGGGDDQQKFVVANGTIPTEYSGNNAQTLIDNHSLIKIFQTTGQSIDIEMTPSAIQSFKVYDLEDPEGNTDITNDSSEDCAWKLDDMTSEPLIGKINVWLGRYSSLENKTILIVVTCENSEVYGIVASAN